MAVSRSNCGLWCGRNRHSAHVGARPCDTRDGCIAQRLKLRVSHKRPHPLLTRREFESNDVSGSTSGSGARLGKATVQLWTHGGFRRRRLLRAEQDGWRGELDERRKWKLHHGLTGDAEQRPWFLEATLAIKNDERVRPTDDTSNKSNGVAGESDGATMNVCWQWTRK